MEEEGLVIGLGRATASTLRRRGSDRGRCGEARLLISVEVLHFLDSSPTGRPRRWKHNAIHGEGDVAPGHRALSLSCASGCRGWDGASIQEAARAGGPSHGGSCFVFGLLMLLVVGVAA